MKNHLLRRLRQFDFDSKNIQTKILNHQVKQILIMQNLEISIFHGEIQIKILHNFQECKSLLCFFSFESTWIYFLFKLQQKIQQFLQQLYQISFQAEQYNTYYMSQDLIDNSSQNRKGQPLNHLLSQEIQSSQGSSIQLNQFHQQENCGDIQLSGSFIQVLGYSPTVKQQKNKIYSDVLKVQLGENVSEQKYQIARKKKEQLENVNLELQQNKSNRKFERQKGKSSRKLESPAKQYTCDQSKKNCQSLKNKNQQLTTTLKTINDYISDEISKIKIQKIEHNLSKWKEACQNDEQFQVSSFLQLLGQVFHLIQNQVATFDTKELEMKVSCIQNESQQIAQLKNRDENLQNQFKIQKDKIDQMEIAYQQGKKTIQDLQTKLATLQDAVKTTNQQKKNQINQKDLLLQYLQQLSGLQNQKTQLNQNLQQTKKNARKAKQQITNALFQIDSLKQNKQFMSINWDIRNKIDSQQSWNSYAESIKKIIIEVIEKLKAQVQEARSTKQDIENNNIKTATQQLNKLKESNNKYNIQINQLNNLIITIKVEFSQKQQQLNQKINQANRKNSELQDNLQQTLQKSEEAKIKFNQSVEKLKKQLEQRNSEYSQLNQQNQLQKKELFETKESNQKLLKSVEQLEKQQLIYKNTIRTLEQQLKSQKQFQQYINQVKDQLQSNKLSIDKKNEQIQGLNHQKQKILQQFQQNQNKSKLNDQNLAQKDETIKKLGQELEELKTNYEILEKNIKQQCKQDVQRYKATNIEYTNQIGKLLGQLKVTKQQLTEEISRNQKLKIEFQQREDELRKAQQKLQEKQEMLQTQQQRHKKDQQECENNIKELKTIEVKKMQNMKEQFNNKIKELEAKYKQNNQTLNQIYKSQVAEALNVLKNTKEQLNQGYLREIQQRQEEIKEMKIQLQLRQNKITQLGQIACEIFKQLNQTKDQSHQVAQNELTTINSQYQALVGSYKELQAENTRNILTLCLKEEYIKQTEAYLEQIRRQSIQKDLAIIQLQIDIESLQNKIKDLESQLLIEETKRFDIQQLHKVEMIGQRQLRQQKYNENMQIIVKFNQEILQQQQRSSAAQVESLKAIISGFKEAQKLGTLVQEKKQQFSNIVTIQRNQQQKQKQEQLEQKVYQLNKIIISLQKNIGDLQEQKQKISLQLQQTDEFLKKQTRNAQNTAEIISNFLKLMQSTNLEQFLQEAQQQAEKISDNLGLMFANIRSHVQRFITQNLVIQNQFERSNTLIQARQTQSNELQAEIKRLQIQLKNEREVNNEVSWYQNAVVQQKQKQISVLELQIKQKDNLLDQTLSEKDKIQRSLKASQSENDKLSKNLKTLQLATSEKQQNMNNQCDRIKAQKLTEQQLKSQIKSLKDQISILKKSIENNRLSKEDISKKYRDQDENISKYLSQIQKLNIQIKQSVLKVEKLEKQLKQKDQTVNQLSLKNQQLERNKKTTNSNSNFKLQNQNLQLKQNNKYLNQQLQDFRQDIKTLQRVLQNKNEELSICKQENQRYCNKIKSLQQANKNKIEVGTSRLRSTQPPLSRNQVDRARIRQLSPNVFIEKVENQQKSKGLFSSYCLLDKYKEEKEFLINSISSSFKVRCVDSSQLFTMNQNSKFRGFNFILQKAALTQQSYAFLFCNKDADNKNNIFAYVTYKANPKTSIIMVLLLNLTKRKLYPRKQNFDTKIEPLRYQYQGELNMGGTLKIKPNEKKLECLQTKYRYFDIAKNSEIFDRQVPSVELSNMQIYQIQLE